MNAVPMEAPRNERPQIITMLQSPETVKRMNDVATKYLTADRMARLCINAINRTPDLARCDPKSVLGSIMMSCALGLETNTINQHAYLIPFNNRRQVKGEWTSVMECQFMIGYRGYIVLAKRNPALVKIRAWAIHENDEFQFCEGSEFFLKWSMDLRRPRGKLVGACCYTKERQEFGEDEAATVLPLEELEKIRAKSQTWSYLARQVEEANNDNARRKAEQKLAETPWVMWEGEMAAKSAVRRHAKQLDLSHGLQCAFSLEDAGDRVDMGKMIDPEYTKALAEGEALPEPAEEPEPEQAALQRSVARPVEIGGTRGARDEGQDAGREAGGRDYRARVTEGDSGQLVDQQERRTVDPKEAERREKENLAAYAAEYGITLDRRKALAALREEVGQIRDGSHPGLAEGDGQEGEGQQAGDEGEAGEVVDPETGEILEAGRSGGTETAKDTGSGGLNLGFKD